MEGLEILEAKNWRVLHIDDDEEDNLIVKSMLKDARGNQITLEWAPTFEAGEQALQKNHYQAVLVDYDLGGRTGIDLIRRFVQRGYNAPMILLTGRGSYDVDVEAMHAGATLYLTKNEINPLLLERSIRYAIERKQSEQALREQDRRLSVALQAAQLGSWTYSFETHQITFDERADELYGASKQTINHDELVETNFHPDDQQAMWSALERAGNPNGDGLYTANYRIRQPDGSWCWLRAWGKTEFEMQDGRLRPVQLIGASRDITHEKQNELELEQSNLALRESELNYRRLAEELEVERTKLEAAIDQLTIGVGIADAEGTTLSMNRAGLALHGFSSVEEMLSRLDNYINEFELRHLDGRVLPLEEWPASKALRGEYITQFMVILRNKQNGQEHTISYSSVPVRNARGELIFNIYQMEDLAASMEFTRSIEESRSQLQNVLDSLMEGVIIIAQDGQVLDMNPAAITMMGYSSREEARKGMADFFGEYEVASLDGIPIQSDRWPLMRVIQGEIFTGYELMVSNKVSGHVWIGSFNGRPFTSETGEPAGGVLTMHDITDRKQAEGRLVASEERYRLAARAANDVVWDWDLLTDMIGWNEALTTLFGYPQHQYNSTSGSFWKDRIHPDDKERVLNRIHQVVDGNETNWEDTYRFLCENGSYAEVVDRGWVVRDDAGRPIRMVGAMRDITGQKESERVLRTSEERFRQLADAMPQLVWTAQPDGTVDYYNQRYHLYGGIAPVKEDHWEWGPVLHDDDLQPTLDAWNHALETGDVYQIEHRVRMADGSLRWHLSRGIPVKDETGAVTRWYGTATDIHDFRETQERLLQREQRMRHLFDANLIGIVTRDWSGRVLEANDAYLNLIGYSAEELATIRIADITPSEYHHLDEENFNSLRNQGFYRPYEKEYVRKDGTRIPVMIGYTVVHSAEQDELIGFVVDMSDLKRTQAELAGYAEKLKRSNEELENFAFVASHDLQEPLRKIQMFSSSLRRRMSGQLDEDISQYLNRMQNATERMQDMINGLLELSRVNTRGENFTSVDMNSVTREVLSDLEARIHSEQAEVSLSPLPLVTGDPMQLHQLMQNLIGNAIKFHHPDVSPRVSVSGETMDDYQVVIRVEDNGIGLGEAHLEQIFQPFMRLHGRSEYEGSGMGLAICRKIVERHNGRLTASNRPEGGSCFTITLPVGKNK